MNLGLRLQRPVELAEPDVDRQGFGGGDRNEPIGEPRTSPARRPPSGPTRKAPRSTAPYIDMNGDGLPDRVDSYTSGELWVALNLGYRFAEKVLWAEGRTAANQDLAGSFSAGFTLNAYEFAGGVVYNEGVGFSQFAWIDIDGDGVPDSVDATGDGQPATIFGAGDGMERAEVTYGEYPVGEVLLDVVFDDNDVIDLPGGQTQVSRSTGLWAASTSASTSARSARWLVTSSSTRAGTAATTARAPRSRWSTWTATGSPTPSRAPTTKTSRSASTTAGARTCSSR